MDVESFEFFKWLAIASLIAAVAAQSKDINGRRFKAIRFFSGLVFFATTGFACGLGMSRWWSDPVSVIAAVMAIVLLRLLPEQVFSGLLNRWGIRSNEDIKGGK